MTIITGQGLCVIAVAVVVALQVLQKGKQMHWHVFLPIVGVVGALTASVSAAQTRLPPARASRHLVTLLDLLDHRYRKCETLHVVARELVHQLRSMRQAPVDCKEALAYLDLPRVAVALPALAMSATSAGSMEAIRSFVDQVARDNCQDGTIYPADLATEIQRSVTATCTSRNFKFA